MQKPYKHIIWDWNGTLLDDAEISVSIMNSLLRQRDLSLITLDSYRNSFGFPVEDYYRSLGFDFSRESFADLAACFVSDYAARRRECRLHTGAENLLMAIPEKGRTQYLLSASHENDLVAAVHEYGIAAFFEELAGIGNRHAAGKVARGIEMLTAAGLAPEDCLLVGDSLHDAEVAEALACDCVLMSCGHQSRKRLESSGLPVFDSFTELAQLFTGT
ncbi:HAD family hydrolase [Spirochaeta dissipatitropha]